MCMQLLSNAGAILLQREIPEAVNLEVAKVCMSTTCHSYVLLCNSAENSL